MKKLIIIFVILVAVVGLISSCSENEVYNMNPDTSKKVIGSKSLLLDRLPIENTEQLMRFSDLVVIGNVVSEGKLITETIGTEEVFKAKGADINIELTEIDVKIDKILYGKVSSDIIKIVQVGKPNSDIGETKIKKNKKVLLVLSKDNDKENIYSSVDFENGIFEIIDNKLMSYSDNKNIAKYDNISVDILIKDIKETKK